MLWVNEVNSFGRRFLEAESFEERLALEAAEGRRSDFRSVDRLLGTLIASALRGERIAEVEDGRVELKHELTAEERAALAENFEVAGQERRGSWHLPESETLSLGLIHSAHWCREDARLLVTLAEAEREAPQFRGDPQAVAVWVLEPLFEALFLPLKVRGTKIIGVKDAEQQEALWAKCDPLFKALQIPSQALDPFRPRRGWSGHGMKEVAALRAELAAGWTSTAELAGERYRLFRLAELCERYYSRAKKGPPLRRSVLTKPLGRTLTAYFGGDWLAFLAYLGEEANPAEEIVQSLPQTKLVTGGASKAATLATEHGISEQQMKGLLAAYFQTADGTSPIEQRVATLKRYWQAFDRLHAELETGGEGLWGLIQEHDYVMANTSAEEDGDYRPRAWEHLLPAELNEEIERLWGVGVLPRWPDVRVTEPAPHARLAECMGPALRFWQGASLTVWFLCVGPYSRTSIEGLAEYHSRELAELDRLAAPVDKALFSDLKAAQERDGDPEFGGGITITLSVGSGSGVSRGRHVRFETLRDIITFHRRRWTKRYLDSYLQSAWDLELRDLGDRYHRVAAERGKEPTVKQFAKTAAGPANRWFAGDLTAAYNVLGLKGPPPAARANRLVPSDPDSFATLLYEEMRGVRSALPPSWKEDPEERRQWNDFMNLASQCVKYLQIQEASGAPPTLAQFGRQQFSYRAAVLSHDIDEAWDLYASAIARVLAGSRRQ